MSRPSDRKPIASCCICCRLCTKSPALTSTTSERLTWEMTSRLRSTWRAEPASRAPSLSDSTRLNRDACRAGQNAVATPAIAEMTKVNA